MSKKIISFLTVAVILLVNCSCGSKQEDEREIYHGLTGVVDHLYGQNKGMKLDGISIYYSLSLINFIPADVVFEEYNNSFNEDEEYRFIFISENTKIYDANNKEIEPTDLQSEDIVRFSVKFISKSLLEAVEVRKSN